MNELYRPDETEWLQLCVLEPYKMHLHQYMPPVKDLPSIAANRSERQESVSRVLQAISETEPVLLALVHTDIVILEHGDDNLFFMFSYTCFIQRTHT